MSGFDAHYVPGWDCHGLPIEIKVDEQLGRRKAEMPVNSFLSACRAYAQKYVDLQREQFIRLGVWGYAGTYVQHAGKSVKRIVITAAGA